MDEKIAEYLKFEINSNNKYYNVEDIYNSVIYARKLEVGYLLGLY